MKTETLTIRVRPSTKKLAEQLAEAEDRSLASLIEHLIKKAAATKER